MLWVGLAWDGLGSVCLLFEGYQASVRGSCTTAGAPSPAQPSSPATAAIAEGPQRRTKRGFVIGRVATLQKPANQRAGADNAAKRYLVGFLVLEHEDCEHCQRRPVRLISCFGKFPTEQLSILRTDIRGLDSKHTCPKQQKFRGTR